MARAWPHAEVAAPELLATYARVATGSRSASRAKGQPSPTWATWHQQTRSTPFSISHRQELSDRRQRLGAMASVDLELLSVRELLALWASALRELRQRGVIRTFNNPIGDIAEELVAIHYDGQRGSFSQKTWDVRAGNDFLQVKALRETGNRTRRSLSPIRSDDGYTAVIVVIFKEDLRVAEAIRIPRKVVNERFERRSHVNGRIIRLSRRLLTHPAVERIELSDASLDADRSSSEGGTSTARSRPNE